MDLLRARFSGWLWAMVAVGSSGLAAECCGSDAPAQKASERTEAESAKPETRDVRSPHFLIHTDLSPGEASELVERMETMLRLISAYWGRPARGVIECYVVHNLDEFPARKMHPVGIREVRTAGGMTLMEVMADGKRNSAKSVVYACGRPEVVQHEAVHAYCHQTFGRIGPVWYSEGMAEMGHYWAEDDHSICADRREIEFLRKNPPKSLAEPLSSSQTSGDGWQNYASRWALCHFLVYNPNYSQQFLVLGRGFLTGKDVSFEKTYGAVTRQLFFEYVLFLRNIGPGYRVDLCAWDWKKKFAGLPPGRSLTATVAAGRGWQPTGLMVRAGARCEYLAAGTWTIHGASEAVDANGDGQGRGRLVGAWMKDYQLGEEFELGTKGSFSAAADGDLYLRCRNDWGKLAGDSGHVRVKFKLEGRGPSLGEIEDRAAGQSGDE